VAEGGANGRGEDPPRLLAARSQFAYTDRLDQAMHDEPEAVSASEQRHLTDLAHRRDRQRLLDAWKPARSLLMAGIVSFTPNADSRSRSDLRLIERTMKRIDARLRA
jgi:hypothetical protein